MAIAYDATGGSQTAGVAATSITLAWVGGSFPADGALMLAQLVTTTVTGALTLPDGSWTVVADVTNTGSTLRQIVARRAYVAGGPTSYTFTFASSRTVRGGLTARTGVSTTTPLDAGPSSTEGTSTTVAGGVTTATANALALGFCGNAGSVASTPSGGWTERYEFGGVCRTEAAEQAVVAPGAVSGTWTAGSATSTILTVLALRDAAAAGSGVRSQVVVAG